MTSSEKSAARGELIARTPQCTATELSSAAESCAEAFKSWRTTPVSTRARVMHKLEGAIRDNTDALAKVLTQETTSGGKTIADAKGDIFRGLEVVEMSCNIPAMIQGDPCQSQAADKAMIPLWMFPPATTAGNTFLMKPSERVPLSAGSLAMMLAEMASDCGLPPGVLNVVHGGHDTVNFLCDNETHADAESVVNQLVGASCGAAGQRCMAISVAVFVGASKELLGAGWIPKIAEAAGKLRVGPGDASETDVGPLISQQAAGEGW
eukprot:Skav212379  [mRNA]  locus=scaffold1983:164350:173228:+ [translate_table: standard]